MFCARALMRATAFPSATHASLRVFRFGASLPSSSATWRAAKSQSGCLPFGSLLTNQQRQSATRHGILGFQSFGCQRKVQCRGKPPHAHRAVVANATTACLCQVGRGKEWLQNANTTNSQGSAAMAMPSNINVCQVSVFSPALAPVRSLTGRSSGHQQGPRLRHCLGPCWCPAHLRCSGAAYLGR